MKTGPWNVDEALDLYRDYPSYGQVIAATHPCRVGTHLGITHDSDDELVALVTIAAIKAGMEVVVIGSENSCIRVVHRIIAVADALGRDCFVSPVGTLTSVRFSTTRTTA
jgi:hypothetical protein